MSTSESLNLDALNAAYDSYNAPVVAEFLDIKMTRLSNAIKTYLAAMGDASTRKDEAKAWGDKIDDQLFSSAAKASGCTTSHTLIEQLEIVRLFVIAYAHDKQAANVLGALSDIKVALIGTHPARKRADMLVGFIDTALEDYVHYRKLYPEYNFNLSGLDLEPWLWQLKYYVTKYMATEQLPHPTGGESEKGN